jgi:putative ABC transport system substrate-binding protein
MKALKVGNYSLIWTHRATVVELAAQYQLPTVYEDRDYPDVGGLISYGVSYPDLFRRAATYVDRILKAPSLAISP